MSARCVHICARVCARRCQINSAQHVHLRPHLHRDCPTHIGSMGLCGLEGTGRRCRDPPRQGRVEVRCRCAKLAIVVSTTVFQALILLLEGSFRLQRLQPILSGTATELNLAELPGHEQVLRPKPTDRGQNHKTKGLEEGLRRICHADKQSCALLCRRCQ